MSNRGQAVLDSMLLLCASVAVIAALAPAYGSAYDLSFDARTMALSRIAAQRIGAAASLCQAMGEGAEFSGEVFVPQGANVSQRESEGVTETFLFAARRAAGGPSEFPIARDCRVYGGCGSQNCRFRAYFRGGCVIELQ